MGLGRVEGQLVDVGQAFSQAPHPSHAATVRDVANASSQPIRLPDAEAFSSASPKLLIPIRSSKEAPREAEDRSGHGPTDSALEGEGDDRLRLPQDHR